MHTPVVLVREIRPLHIGGVQVCRENASAVNLDFGASITPLNVFNSCSSAAPPIRGGVGGSGIGSGEIRWLYPRELGICV